MLISLEQYKLMLKQVNFFYAYQDSFENSEQYKIEKQQYEKTEKFSFENPEFRKLFNEHNPFNINN